MLVIVLAFAAFGCFAVAGLQIVRQARSAVVREINGSQRQAATEKAADLADAIALAEQRISVSANQPLVKEAIERRATAVLSDALDRTLSSTGVVGSAIVALDGIVVSNAGVQPDPAAVRNRIFRSARGKRSTTVTISTPITKDDGTALAHALQVIDLSTLVPRLNTPLEHRGAAVSLFRHDGRLLHTTLDEKLAASAPEFLALLRSGDSGAVSFYSASLGERRIAAAAPVPGTDLVAVVGASAAAANNAATELVKQLGLTLLALAAALVVLGGGATVVIRRSRRRLLMAHHHIAMLADTDPMTGLFNRRYFERALTEASRRPGGTSVVMVDMDGLKQLNDHFGHAAGDEAIRRVGAALRNSVRPEDDLARIGGDEFAVLVPTSEVDTVAEVAQRIERAVAALSTYDIGRLSVSIGYASGPSSSVTETLQRADRNLYGAKADGREVRS